MKPMPIDRSNKGYVRLYRNLLDDPIFRDKPPGWLKIWIYIQLRANWRESEFRPRQGETITVPAGSLITSLEKLATHAALSKEHARRCLDYLVRTHAVTLRTTHHWTMITIVNWAVYQQSDDDGHHAEHHAGHHTEPESATHDSPHRTPHAATLSKEVKNLSKKYQSNSGELDSSSGDAPPKTKPTPSRKAIDPDIQRWFEEEFWPLYPRHEGKSKALEAANAKATTPERRAFYLGRLKSQLPAYLHRKNDGGQRVIPMGATWFNQDRADDELDLEPESNDRGSRAPEPNDYPAYVPLTNRAS